MHRRVCLLPLALLTGLALLPAACGEIDSRTGPPRVLLLDADTEDLPQQVHRCRKSYSAVVADIEFQRMQLAGRYRVAVESGNRAARQEILSAARDLVFASLVEKILPAWYGTEWDFNGTSQVPGEGQIACGYFVSTTLRDAGFRVPRIKMAQQASQVMIECLADPGSIEITVRQPVEDFEARLRKAGAGIYLVGLDTHVGFVVNDGNSLAFIHSSYYPPKKVVKAEPATGDNPLRDSNYRVVGRILADRMLVQWLLGEAFVLRAGEG